jgi:hypothetical protein
MIELFDDFVNGIEDIIDKSINDLTESGIQLVGPRTYLIHN